MKIASFAQDRGACTGWRIRMPSEKIKKLGLADVNIIGLADPNTQKYVEEADIVFLGRAADQKALDLIRHMKQDGKKVVFDLDDSMFDISPFSPHYRQLGIMPVNFDDGRGNTVKGWQDGVDGFDVLTNRRVRKSFIGILREVDCITITTEPLRQLYSRFNDRVRMIPNAVDFDLWRKYPVRKTDDRVRVTYPAGSNHQEDWMFMRSILKRLQDEVPNWDLYLVGVPWHGQWGDLDASRIVTYPWVDFEAYPYLMNLVCADIGIAPISEIGFNDCRSSIKWAEYAALGTACVATDYGPYKRDCTNGVDAILVRERDEWFEALRRLITDESERKKIAEAALSKVRQSFNLDFVADKWVDTFKEVHGNGVHLSERA